MIGKYVVFVTNDINGQEHYWTGVFLDYRMPETETDLSYARRFHTAREAYNAAADSKKLQRYRVGVRLHADVRKAA